MGKPHFWTTTPGIAELGDAYSCWSLAIGIALGTTVALFFGFLFFGVIQRGDIRKTLLANRPILLLCAVLLSVPLLIFLLSQRGQSVFVDRYLLPVVIGMCFLICQLLSWLVVDSSAGAEPISIRTKIQRFLWFGSFTTTAVIALLLFPSYWQLPAPDKNAALLPLLPENVPIVVEAVDLFDQLLAYHRQPRRDFVYLLDWENVTSPSSPRGEVSGYHEMENWRKVGYFSGSIQYSEVFLSRARTFVVIDDPGLFFFERRILHNPAFTVEPLGTFRGAKDSGKLQIWLVCRRP